MSSYSPSRPPPPASASSVNRVQLPKGQCRYILMIPGLKGHRCGCVAFDHNQAMPGATCHCGHLSCFHVASADAPSPSPGRNRDEMELIKKRVRLLEDNLEREQHDRLSSIATRVGNVEEVMDKNREETLMEIKGSYRNIYAAWQLVEQLEKRMKHLEGLYQIQNERMNQAGKELRELRNRNLELMDSDDCLEERIEKLESAEAFLSLPLALEKKRSSAHGTHLASPAAATPRRRRASIGHLLPATTMSDRLRSVAPVHVTKVEYPVGPSLLSGSWTVHISLLPSKEQPFPFEKDTPSYKRCLSRGLHRMVAVEGNDAQSFMNAISRTFGDLLKGRPWMPLQAKLCDAQRLQGLPMLRPLEQKLLTSNYDAEFLREHCAVGDGNGKMDSLYIALRHETLSWDFLRQSPVYVEGLESSWNYDAYLDKKVKQEMEASTDGIDSKEAEDKRQENSAAPSSVTVKRSASEMACSPGFDECEAPRKRLMRSRKSSLLGVRRQVETA